MCFFVFVCFVCVRVCVLECDCNFDCEFEFVRVCVNLADLRM